MDGITGVTQRIADIQARVAQVMQPRRSLAPPVAGAATTTSDFAAALAAAGGSEATATPAAPRPTGGYGRVEPPAALAAYGNGRVPPDALAPLGIGSHRLFRPAADAFSSMRADAAAAGITIGITDSYRTYDAQVRLAEEKGLYRDGGLAAVPGTSNHGWGLAVDLDLDDRALQWMRENGSRYGFVEDTPREPWHWGYRPATDP